MKLVNVFFSLVMIFGTIGVSVQAAEPSASKNAVVHLKHFTDDLHAAKMALGFANEFARQGAKTTLLLSLEGVRLADKKQPINMSWGLVGASGQSHGGGHGSAPQTLEDLYTSFVKAGGKVLVCPHCAASAGCELKQLRDGAKTTAMNDMAAVLLDADLVLDY